MSSRIQLPHHEGMVVKKTIGHYFVQNGGAPVRCEISNRLRKELVYPIADPSSLRRRVMEVRSLQVLDPVAVGDVVRFIDNGDGTGLIEEVLPRRSRLARREAAGAASRRHALEQVIVANLDQVVCVFSAALPAPSWNLLDRYLVSAESLDLRSLVVITKMDLAGESPDLEEAVNTYRKIGYRVILTSSETGRGLEELRDALRGQLSALIGKSGVGKSSLLNALQPGLGLRVNVVSDFNGKGRHTTTHLEYIPLEIGGGVVDTPGMREFGLWQTGDDDPALFFPEMRPLVGACRFGLDCTHLDDPGCAVRRAVAAGAVTHRRYQSMLKIMED